jgi:hypothetical protein
MEKTAEQLYLDLIIKTLSFTLWPEPPIPIEVYNYHRKPYRRAILRSLARFLERYGITLSQSFKFSENERNQGEVWPGYADSMIGIKRLQNIRECMETIIAQNVEGDFIETGIWRGGACILMRAVLAAYKIQDRIVYAADSFQGLPKPDIEKYPAEEGNDFHFHEVLAVSREQVEQNFRKYGLLDSQVVFLEGWFKDTLPLAPIEKLALMRLDGDMYGSTMEALDALYPKLSPGGFCIIDDYALEGCRKAVEDYRESYRIKSPLVEIDWTGRYWKKE